ncbi:MAG: VWA domain-containing protein, partial [Shewanella fodinae]|nr:VWA domain-containing protein [Shewanella fodinae]
YDASGRQTADRHPRELILVIDTSGSMAGDAMAQAKSAVLYALSGLKPQDSFNILAFSSDVQPLAPQALPVTAHNIGLAQQFVRSLEANGGTEMAKALQLALPFTGDTVANESDAALRQVIFMTDGAVGNEDQLFTLIRDRLGNNRLFTIGIGSAPTVILVRRAAELGGALSPISATCSKWNSRRYRCSTKLPRRCSPMCSCIMPMVRCQTIGRRIFPICIWASRCYSVCVSAVPSKRR